MTPFVDSMRGYVNKPQPPDRLFLLVELSVRGILLLRSRGLT